MVNTESSNDSMMRERGFGMIEIVVAMFLMAILALAILPLIITSSQLASSNVTLTTATQLVNKQMDEARGIDATCAALTEFGAQTIGMLETDPRGTVLRIHREVYSPCPVSYPATIDFTTWVTIDGETDVLAETSTKIFLEGAG